ncbi:MAG: hypothetical protein AB9858_01025 [Acidaminococcaceae bacterium]
MKCFLIKKARVQSLLTTLFILTYLTKALLEITFLTEFMAFLSLLIFAFSITSIDRSSQKLISLLVLTSLICLFFSEKPIEWSEAITGNSGIVTLLITAPLLGSILYYSPYERVLLFLSERCIKSTYAFYAVTLSLSATFSLVMGLGALPFVKQLTASIAKNYPRIVFYRGIMRGFSINFFWAPNLVSLAFTLQSIGISWNDAVLPGVFLSLLSYGYALLFGMWEVQRNKQPIMSSLVEESEISVLASNDEITMTKSRQYLYLLGVQIMVILLFIAFFTSYMKYNIFPSVAFVSLIIPLLFALILDKREIWRERIMDYGKNFLPNAAQQFMFFTSIGFFGYALNKSPVIEIISARFGVLAYLPLEMTILAIIAMIGGLAVIGFHPFITISALSILLNELNLGITQIQLVVILTLGYLVYALLSPFASMALLWSSLVHESSYEVSMKQNWLYAVSYSLIMTIVVAIWVRLT